MTTQGQNPGASSTGSSASNTAQNNRQSNGGNQKHTDTYTQAREKTGEVVDQVQEKASEVVDQMREKATSQLSSQKTQVAEGVQSVAQIVRMTGDQLRQKNQGGIAEYTDRAAGGLENFSSFLREKELGEMVSEVENFARREPILFLSGAFTLGLLGARFLKSSGPAQKSNQSQVSTNQWNGTPSSATNGSSSRSTSTARQGVSDYSATLVQNPESSLGRHFGEDSAAGLQAKPNKSPSQSDIDGMSELDTL